MYPRLFARMVYQVGSPAMFDGNRFFPDTGMPIWKIDRRSTRFAVWLPEPLTVATWIVKSLTREECALARWSGSGFDALMLGNSRTARGTATGELAAGVSVLGAGSPPHRHEYTAALTPAPD